MEIKFWKDKKINITRDQAIPFAALFGTIGLTLGFALLFNLTLAGATPIMLIFLLSFLFFATWIAAGMIVFKALFLVGGELTLMIFLAQSYCDVKNRTQASDAALVTLFGFGLIYIAVLFIKSLNEGYIETSKKFKERNQGERSWTVGILFVLSMSLFLWQLYEFINPIVFHLCVYSSPIK